MYIYINIHTQDMYTYTYIIYTHMFQSYFNVITQNYSWIIQHNTSDNFFFLKHIQTFILALKDYLKKKNDKNNNNNNNK
jgi:hypothetical protein